MTNLSKLLLKIELWVKNNESISNSLINWQFTQASEYLKEYLTATCEIDLWNIEIDANDMVELEKLYILD